LELVAFIASRDSLVTEASLRLSSDNIALFPLSRPSHHSFFCYMGARLRLENGQNVNLRPAPAFVRKINNSKAMQGASQGGAHGPMFTIIPKK
jgi:hypothetical protein